MVEVLTKRFDLVDGITYGPIHSRRLGTSLGINVLPFGVKVCSFNCNYCQCGWTTDVIDDAVYKRYRFPTVAEIADGVEKRLRQAKQGGERFDVLTFAGNGEPTLHPEFAEVVQAVKEVRDRWMPSAKVSVLSNAVNIPYPQVLGGLNLLDERIMKLDAGSEEKFLEMNSPVVDVSLWDIIQGLKQLKDVVIQSMFTQGRRDNTGEKDIDDWIRVLAMLKEKVRYVQIYSIDRIPADPKLKQVDRTTLECIARRLKDETGIKGEVF